MSTHRQEARLDIQRQRPPDFFSHRRQAAHGKRVQRSPACCVRPVSRERKRPAAEHGVVSGVQRRGEGVPHVAIAGAVSCQTTPSREGLWDPREFSSSAPIALLSHETDCRNVTGARKASSVLLRSQQIINPQKLLPAPSQPPSARASGPRASVPASRPRIGHRHDTHRRGGLVFMSGRRGADAQANGPPHLQCASHPPVDITCSSKKNCRSVISLPSAHEICRCLSADAHAR